MYLFDVTVPPNIDDSLSSSDVIVREGANETLTCKATGSPTPNVKWKRDDNTKITINKTLSGKRHNSSHLFVVACPSSASLFPDATNTICRKWRKCKQTSLFLSQFSNGKARPWIWRVSADWTWVRIFASRAMACRLRSANGSKSA